MTRRRRMFDIEVPEESLDAATPASDGGRRGPMATAVRETAESLRERSDLEAQIRAENDALAHEHVRLRRAGLVIQPIPTHAIDAARLIRDRASDRDGDLAELKASILALGLSNPIRVQPKPDGRYELIQGWRRLRAFIELEADLGDGRFTHIPAGHAPAEDALEVSYRRMVDENLVRRDVSFVEMARLARSYAADPATSCDVDSAVSTLFRSAGYQKRSYIRAFVALLDRLGDVLAYPASLSRNLGLDLRRALDESPALAGRLRAALDAAPQRSVDEETAILRQVLAEASGTARPAGLGPEASGRVATRPRSIAAPRARAMTLVFETDGGLMRCVASEGHLTLRGSADFGDVPAERLERALRAFMLALADSRDADG